MQRLGFIFRIGSKSDALPKRITTILERMDRIL